MTENLFTNNATDQEQLIRQWQQEIAALEAETAKLLRRKYKEQICALKDGVAELKSYMIQPSTEVEELEFPVDFVRELVGHDNDEVDGPIFDYAERLDALREELKELR